MRWLCLVSMLGTASPALAGNPDAPTRVTGRLDGTTARLTARYELPVGANEWTRGSMLALPAGALVTGARVAQDGRVHRLDLMAANAAGAKFQALAVDVAAPGPKTSAVMIEGGVGGVTVSTASPRPGRLVIDLEISMPTCFHRDLRYAMVPTSWYEAAGRDLRARATDDTLADVCPTNGEEAGMWLGFASPELARRASGDRFGVSADRVDLAGDSIVRFELDVATMLGDAPRDLATVLIVDGSRSISDDDREAQRALVESYLDKAPGSRVQVVAVARTAQAVLPAWTRASKAHAAVDAALRSLVPRNGSNFDAGLAEAATWLKRLDGTRRVVLVTDERMATRLAHASDTALRGILPPGTLLHVVVLSSGSGLQRDDEAKLASLARSTEGFAVRLGTIPDDDGPDATMLVRPISIDRFTIVAPGWDSLPRDRDGPPCDDEMDVHEGHGCTWWRQHHGVDAPPITVEGWIWGTRLSRTLTPDRSRARDVTRELSMMGLVPSELHALAEAHAQAVNATWSLYGAWGGTAGYDGPFGGGTGFGAICGCGRIGTIGHGSGTGSGMARRDPPSLRDQLEPAIEACTLGTESVTVALELTGIEIADVHVTVSGPPPAEGRRVEQCVREVVWAASPLIATPRDHQLVSFVVGN